jgi:hypothetical protein
MTKPYSYLLLIAVLAPGFLTSEPPQIPLGSNNTSPVEILFSGITPLESNTAVLLRIEGKSLNEISSSCSHKESIIKNDDTNMVVQWRPDGACPLPLISVNKKNYILPINGYYPDLATLSDVSTDTLKNTLQAGAFLRADFRLSSFQVRTFFSNIESILSARNTKFSLPIPGAPLPTKATHLPNSPRPFRADATDGVHHGFDFYVNEGTPVRAIEDGTIIHVKRDFSWDEMEHLLPGQNELEEQENLDVYRGNTVYLKTRSGHVAIYAHLSNIPSNINIGKSVSR